MVAYRSLTGLSGVVELGEQVDSDVGDLRSKISSAHPALSRFKILFKVRHS